MPVQLVSMGEFRSIGAGRKTQNRGDCRWMPAPNNNLRRNAARNAAVGSPALAAMRSPMDLRKLKTLIDLVSESNISELEITEAEGKVRIVKSAPVGTFVAAAPVAPVALPVHAPTPAEIAETAASAAAAATEISGKVIKSPMVGTYYRAASPGANPFVEVGSEIKEGQPACIIEAMKIMNEIESEVSGKIVRMLCENGQPVEFGQPLFIVE